MRKQTLTWLSMLLVLAVTLSACGTAAPVATAVPQSDAGTSSNAAQAPAEEQLSGTICPLSHDDRLGRGIYQTSP